MKKIRLFYLITGLTAGGAEIMLKRFLTKLNRDKFEILVCSITKTLDLFDDIKPYIRKFYCLNLNRYNDFPRVFTSLRYILINERPDILHCFMPHANLLGRFAALGLRISVISSLWVVLLKKKYLNFLDFLSQKLVNIYTVNSYSLRNFVIKYGIKPKKVKVIESGVDPDQFNIDINIEKYKRELGLSNFPVLTMVAHLRTQKDYPTMIKAIAYLQTQIDISFISCGYGNQFENETLKIKNLIKELGLNNIKLLGVRDDIPEIFAITDIWVSSTLYEGQSNSLLEAMLMKKPIVTTSIPENEEVVRNEKEALLVPIKSPLLLAEGIKRLIIDKKFAKSLSENAYKRVLSRYDIKKTIKNLDNLYRVILDKKSSY